MATIHIGANKEDIAKTVLMPGDPLRAKYIAENFLTEYKLINQTRNMLGYTGFYKGHPITVFASGMGMASMGIYCYELFKYYDVDSIIRIGTCGSNSEDVKILDVIVAEEAFSLSTYANLFDGDKDRSFLASKKLNEKIFNVANELNIVYKSGKIITSDIFDPYVDYEKYMANYPKDNYLASEMEAFSLFYIAKKLDKKATCILTVVDSHFDKRIVSPIERQTSLNDMILLALESTIKE